MRSTLGMAIAAALVLAGSSSPCFATANVVGRGRPLGEVGFEEQLRSNPTLRSFVQLRGYPDWVEEVEVDSVLPLDAYELRLYYLRLDREVSFSRAYILGRPHMTLRMFDRAIAPNDRARIEEAYLAIDPARRSEIAADRALAAAERAERAADAVERLADHAEQFSDRMEREFNRRLRK